MKIIFSILSSLMILFANTTNTEGITSSFMFQILFVGFALVALFMYRNMELKKIYRKVNKQKKAYETLLSSSSQGYLLFDNDFIVDEQYSKACNTIFEQKISGKNILDILYGKKDEAKAMMKSALEFSIENSDNDGQKDLMLSVLPNTIEFGSKILKIQFDIQSEYNILIIDDITKEEEYKRKAIQEKQKLKMIVAIASEPDMFFELKRDYDFFVQNHKKYILDTQELFQNINDLYRKVHTFKGSFSQFFMDNMVSYLHKLETKISFLLHDDKQASNQTLLDLLQKEKFNDVLEKEIQSIVLILGDNFLNHNKKVSIDITNLEKLIKFAESIAKKYNQDPNINKLLELTYILNEKPFVWVLKHYQVSVEQIAANLQKKIYPIDFQIDESLYIKPNLQEFTKVLTHIFRNCIDHGIEFSQERVLVNKSEYGTIKTSVYFNEDSSYTTFIIEDDGRGIDLEIIKAKAKELEIDTKDMNRDEILMLIFSKNFSTKNNITTVSGRGIGLDAVKNICDKIGISIKIETKLNMGTKFIFSIPKDYISKR